MSDILEKAQKGLSDSEIRKVNAFFKSTLTLINTGEIDKARSNFTRKMEQGDRTATFNRKMINVLNKMFTSMTKGPTSEEKRKDLKKKVSNSTKKKSLTRRAGGSGTSSSNNTTLSPNMIEPKLVRPESISESRSLKKNKGGLIDYRKKGLFK